MCGIVPLVGTSHSANIHAEFQYARLLARITDFASLLIHAIVQILAMMDQHAQIQFVPTLARMEFAAPRTTVIAVELCIMEILAQILNAASLGLASITNTFKPHGCGRNKEITASPMEETSLTTVFTEQQECNSERDYSVRPSPSYVMMEMVDRDHSTESEK